MNERDACKSFGDDAPKERAGARKERAGVEKERAGAPKEWVCAPKERAGLKSFHTR